MDQRTVTGLGPALSRRPAAARERARLSVRAQRLLGTRDGGRERGAGRRGDAGSACRAGRRARCDADLARCRARQAEPRHADHARRGGRCRARPLRAATRAGAGHTERAERAGRPASAGRRVGTAGRAGIDGRASGPARARRAGSRLDREPGADPLDELAGPRCARPVRRTRRRFADRPDLAARAEPDLRERCRWRGARAVRSCGSAGGVSGRQRGRLVAGSGSRAREARERGRRVDRPRRAGDRRAPGDDASRGRCHGPRACRHGCRARREPSHARCTGAVAGRESRESALHGRRRDRYRATVHGNGPRFDRRRRVGASGEPQPRDRHQRDPGLRLSEHRELRAAGRVAHAGRRCGGGGRGGGGRSRGAHRAGRAGSGHRGGRAARLDRTASRGRRPRRQRADAARGAAPTGDRESGRGAVHGARGDRRRAALRRDGAGFDHRRGVDPWPESAPRHVDPGDSGLRPSGRRGADRSLVALDPGAGGRSRAARGRGRRGGGRRARGSRGPANR